MITPSDTFRELLHRLGVAGPARVHAFQGTGAPKTSRGSGVPFAESTRRPRSSFFALGKPAFFALPVMVLVYLALFAAPAVAPALASGLEKPEVGSPTEVKAETATLNGTLSPRSLGEANSTYEFLYKASTTGECKGESKAPAKPATAAGSEAEGVSTPVSGLKPGTEYAVCLIVHNTAKTEEPVSTAITFTTVPAPATEAPSPIGATTATFKGTLTPLNSTVGTQYYFFYNLKEEAFCTNERGTNTEPETPLTGSGVAHVKTEVTELEPNQKYTVCLVSVNAFGQEEDLKSPPIHFTTGTAPPKVDSQSASTNSTEATLEAQVNPNNQETHAYLQYSTSSAVEGSGALTTATKLTSADLGEEYADKPVGPETLTGLPPGATFYYQAVATNATGTTYGTVQEFTTVPTPSTDPTSAIGATTATFNGHLTPLNLNTATQYHFVYDLGGACTGGGENSTPSAEAGKGTGGAAEATPVVELQLDRLYTVCFVTSNAFGSQQAPPVTFRTLPETYTTDVASSSATLHAVLDPEGNGATSYHFQYVPQAQFEESEFAKAESTPEGTVESSEHVSVEAHIQELTPGSVYHFRVVAKNAAQETIASADQTFTTLPPTGGGSALTDNRQYELVSPPDKHGALVEPIDAYGLIQSSTEGNAFTYITSAPTESQPQGNANAAQILATRGADGWSDRDIATRNESSPGVTVGNGQQYQLFSSDLSRSIFEGRFGVETPGFTAFPGEETSPHATELTPYLRENFTCPSATCYTPLLTTTDVTSGATYGQNANEYGNPGEPALSYPFRGATPDLSHVVLDSENVPLTAGGAPGLYEWSAAKPPAEQLQFVSVLPPEEGGGPALGTFGSYQDGGEETRNAISEDGSRIIWSANHALYMRDTALGETVRLDTVRGGSGASGRTGPQPQFDIASSDGSMVFFTDTQRLTASSRAGENHESDAAEPDLYACKMVEVEVAGHKQLKCDLTDLSPDTNPGEERAAVQDSVLAASEDGSYVYFVANGVLGDGAEHGASTGNCKDETKYVGSGETCNLYVEHDNDGGWEAPRFIAAISGIDAYHDAHFAALSQHTAGSSPDGRYLAFMSDRSLTGYDNVDVNPGAYEEEEYEVVYKDGQPVPAHDEEVYLYHAETSPSGQLEPGKLVCASCNPTGARPDGERYFSAAPSAEEEQEEMGFVGGYDVWEHDQWLAANTPGWVNYSHKDGAHQPRYLSNSGRLFFNSHDPLVPQDVNGQWDVYEYEPPGAGDCTTSTRSASDVYDPKAEGCVGLISSGESSEQSAFLDASESGGDVFFMTLSQLVPQDVDHSMDVYDAHECTTAAPCFPPSAAAPPPCTTEASCKPAPEPQPSIYGPPPSATFSGPGNIAPEVAPPPKKVVKKTVKCKKPKKLSHGKCVKPKKKTKGKKSAKGRK
jgi:hypothetical protein